MIDVDISDALRHPGKTFSYSYVDSTEFDGVTMAGPLRIHMSYEFDGGVIRASGKVSTEIAGSCARCLADTRTELDEKFDEIFAERSDDESTYTFSRESKRLTLDQLIRDLLLASVPIQMLCKEDCKGLCPKCGADLNIGPCACTKDGNLEQELSVADSNPFSVLKDLF